MSMSEHEIRQLDQEYGRVEDRRQERLVHTPGPWTSGQYLTTPRYRHIRYYVNAGDKNLTRICDTPVATWQGCEEANACLIAAAPEMLEALEAMRLTLQGMTVFDAMIRGYEHDMGGETDESCRAKDRALEINMQQERIQAAIQKARGPQ